MFEKIKRWWRRRFVKVMVIGDDEKLKKMSFDEAKEEGQIVALRIFNANLSNYTQKYKDLANQGQKLSFLSPEMFEESGGKTYDPFLKKEVTGRIKEVTWLVRKTEKVDDKVKESFIPLKVDLSSEEKFKESLRESKLKEDITNFDTINFTDWAQLGSTTSGQVNYYPYPPGPYTKQQYLQDMWNMQALAFAAYNHNPLAHAGIEVKNSFIIGIGIRVKCKNNKLQEIWEEFEERTDFNTLLQTWNRELMLNGEIFIQPGVNDQGLFDVRSIDPGVVWEVITEPTDIKKVYGYWIQYSTQYQLYTEKSGGGQTQSYEYVIKLADPDSLIHMKINAQSVEKRGRSDLITVLPVLDWIDDYMRYGAIRQIMLSAYGWDVEYQGDAGDLSNVLTSETVLFPPPGSAFVHNQAVKRQLINSTATPGRGTTISNEMWTYFAVGIGVPKEYLGLGDAGNRATAVTATEPAAKSLKARQKYWEGLIKNLLKRMGKIYKISETEAEVIFPEIAPADVVTKVKNLVIGLTENAIAHETFCTMYAKELDITTYDYKEEQQKIKQEIAKDPMLAALFNPALNKPAGGGGMGGGATTGSGMSPSGLSAGQAGAIKTQVTASKR